MKNLLIIEPHMGGHHGVYLRWIVHEALERNYRVFLGTFEDSLRHPLFMRMIEEWRDAFEILTLPALPIDYMKNIKISGLLRRELAYRNLLRQFYNKAKRIFQLDLVFIPYLDYCTNAIAMLRSPFGQTPWAGIIMRAAFHYKKMGIIGSNSRLLWFKKMLFYRLVQQKSLYALFTIDPTLFLYMKEKMPSSTDKFYYLPDPADFNGNISKDAARQKIKIPEDAVLILVYGAISLRKGVDALLNTVATKEFLPNVHILLAGEQEPEIEVLLKSCKINQLFLDRRLHQMNKFLSEEEEYLVFKASDIVWLGYREHYTMSAVIVQACRMGLPVIACKEGLIGWLTKENKLGAVIDELYQKEIYEAIKQVMVTRSSLKRYYESGKNYFTDHTIDNFKKTIYGALI